MADTSKQPRNRNTAASGFTLIELLVAIAVTAVLMTLLFGPMLQAFFFTGQAQAEAAAQSTARTTMEQISRELSGAAGIRDTQGKYLNIPYMDQAGNESTAAGVPFVARIYNAYLDIVPPRQQAPSGNNTFADPTIDPNNNTVTLNSATGTELTPPLILSIAPGTGFTRYFVGLHYPVNLQFNVNTPTVNAEPQPYTNPYDESSSQLRTLRQDMAYGQSYVVKNDLTNTMILYRAEVRPNTPELDPNGNPMKDANGNLIYVPNYNLFSSVYGPGNPNAGQPEPDSVAMGDPTAQPVIDDPDFFRMVTTQDVNPITINLPGGPANYTAAQAADHNKHVYNWTKVAKPVIGATVADLIAPPRNGRGQVLYYDVTGGAVGNSPAPSTDPTAFPSQTIDPGSNPNGTPIPVIPTTVSFGPALVSNDTLAATTSDYVSQGAGPNQLDTMPNTPYIPSLYKAAYGQWQGTPIFTIAENDQNGNPVTLGANGSPFTTGVANAQAVAATLTNNTNLNRSNPFTTAVGATDLIEYDGNGNPVYDVTQSAPIQGATHYVALTFSPASGAANFAMTALPTFANGPDYRDPNNQSSPFWVVKPTQDPGDNNNNEVEFAQITGGTKVLAGSYLNSGDPNYIPGAQIVVNSDRVYGPDMTQNGTPPAPNPNNPPVVPYTRVSASASSSLQANQYAVNYQTGQFLFAPPSTTTGEGPPANTPVQIAFSYQNNLNNNVSPVSADTVHASYNTGSLTQITMGIRLYDVNSHRPAFFSMSNRLVVANATR